MPVLTKEQIVMVDDVVVSDVPVPEWGQDVVVRLRVMTGAQRDEYEHSVMTMMKDGKLTDGRGLKVRLIASCIVDANGQRLFTTPEDISVLNGKSAPILERLFEKAQSLNGIGEAAVAELEKN